MRRMTILILLLPAAAGLRCSADLPGVRDAVGFITAGADLVVSEAADRTGDAGGKGRVQAGGMDRSGDDIQAVTDMKGRPAGGRGSYAAGKKGTAPVKKNKDMPGGAGNKKDMKSDAVIPAENGKSADGKETRKSLSGSDKKNAPGKTERAITADKGKPVPVKKEPVSREDAATTGDAIRKNTGLPDAGQAKRPSGYLAKPRVGEPAAQ